MISDLFPTGRTIGAMPQSSAATMQASAVSTVMSRARCRAGSSRTEVAQHLYAGRRPRRHVHLPLAPRVEMLGHLGFDWILLDNEHGSITVDTAEACIVAAELCGMAPIVRPVGKSPRSSPRSWIGAPGAWQVPHVNTADEARPPSTR